MPRQSDLRFTFEPLKGDAFDVVSFRLEEGLSQPFKLQLELASHNAAIDFNNVLDLTGLFTIWHGETPVRYVHGLVSLFTQGDTGFRRTRYTAVIEPTLARFDLRSNWRIFQGQTVPDIITNVLAEQKLTDLRREICFEHQPREYCVQAGETDLDFIARLAAEEGLLYTFDHRDDGHTLVLTDRVGGLGTIGTHKHCPVIYQPMAGGDATEPALTRFHYTEQVRTARQVQRDYTFTHPRYDQQHTATGDQDLKNQHKDYERYDYPGRYKRDIAGKPFTKTRLTALRNDAKLAHLAGDDARLQPGLAFDLNEHPREDFNDRWRTIAITHEGKQHTSLQEEAFGSGHGTSYEMTASAIRWTSDWKAPLRDKPCIDGPQIATVVGPPGEEIYCDEWGRVKVQFPWDRADKNNDQSSCWIRVAQGWAGATWGAMAVPRIGQELIIGYLDGDPDQPIATGRTYRETNLPPYQLPKHKTRMTIKSQTHKGSGFNELRFEDELGHQEVFIHAEKDKNVHIKHNNTTFVGNDRSEQVGHDEHIEIGHDRSERVGNDEHIAVAQDQHLQVGRDRIHTVGRNHHIDIGGDRVEEIANNRHDRIAADHQVQIGGNAEQSVRNHYRLYTGQRIEQKTRVFDVASNERLILRAPGGSITIDGNGITLDGLAIRIKGPVTTDPIGTGNPLGTPQLPAVPPGPFLGRYTLLKNDQRAFAGYRYRITDGTALLAEGRTCPLGGTEWTVTPAAKPVQAHKAIMRDDQQITETWAPYLMALDDQGPPVEAKAIFPDDFLDQHSGDLD
ncbi:type VI secretion system tip protein VgrG [Pseudomonas sp. FDAARGOS_380]|uniref:type VI secretion system Vgr family protein n=1 Tax=unclassified Pseudomonas TaxID=196821 RepID=UPI000BFBA7CC|nr:MULTISPECIES: type VI secretion system tip protein TssI/VgrG [unclassified Pseudomonas]ATN12799.1 type VI secretion system tip protein VgrG [Pseudomonas sp. FDAARGOS_380]NMX29497.1 type VI secretion system tip protein VgrG [Pseudomonas sp. WS 5406]